MGRLSGLSRAAVIAMCVPCVLVLLAGAGHADTYWKTIAVNNDWRDANNWTAGVPGSSDIVYFTSSNITGVQLNPSVPPNADGRALGINFSGGSDFTISPGVGHVIYAYGSGVTAQGGNQTFTCNVRPSATGVFPVVNSGAGLLAFDGSLMVQPNKWSTVTVSGSGNTRVSQFTRRRSNQITNIDLVKNGSGTLTIVNGYANIGTKTGVGYITGTTTINDGTVSIDDEENLGGNPGGYWNASDVWIPGSFDADALLLNGGTLKATATFAINDSNRGVTMGAAGGTLEVTSGKTLTISNPVAGSGSLTKTGAGTLTLSDTNTYAGTTTVSDGVLSISALGNLGSGGIILDGGTLRTTGSGFAVNKSITLTDNSFLDTQTSSNMTYSGVISDGPGTFGFTKTGSANLVLTGNNTYDGETVLSGATTYIYHNNALGSTIGGTTVNGTLTLGSAGMIVNERLNLNGWLRAYPSSGGSTYAGDITLTGNSWLSSKFAGTTFHVSGAVSGDYNLMSNREVGMVRLSGVNTYKGSTEVARGLLLIGADAPSGAPGALGDATSAVTVGTGSTAGSDNIGLLTDGPYTIGRDIVVNNQNLSGTTTLGGNQTTGASTFSGDITLNRDVILTSANTDGNAVTFSGDISGTGYGITKTGTGTVVLSGTNSYTGPTTVSEGVLSFSAADNLGPGDIILDGGTLRSTGSVGNILYVNNPITLADNGTLDTQHTNYTEYRGVISDGAGTFGFTKIGSRSLRLNANNTYDGETILTGGTTYILRNNCLGTAVGGTTLGNATLSIETNYTTPETLYLNGGTLRTSSQGSTRYWGGDIVLGANDSSIQAKYQTTPATLVINGTISGPYRLLVGRSEPGIVRFGGANIHSGDTRIVRGTLQLDNANALQDTTLDLLGSDTGVLTFGAPAAYTLGGLEGSRNLNMGGKTLAIGNNGQNTAYSGQLSNGSLTKIGLGTLTLSGASTYAGPTTVADGTLAFSHTASNNLIPNSALIDVRLGTTLDVTGLAGTSDLILATGQTLIGNGTVVGNLGVGPGSTISAGASPGRLIITGHYTQSGTMLAELGGLGKGTAYDWIDVAGTATLGGTIDVDLVDSFMPSPGDCFDILTAGGGITNDDLSGITFDFTHASTGLGWWTSIAPLPGGGEALRVCVSPEPATITIFALGGLAALARRRKKR